MCTNVFRSQGSSLPLQRVLTVAPVLKIQYVTRIVPVGGDPGVLATVLVFGVWDRRSDVQIHLLASRSRCPSQEF